MKSVEWKVAPISDCYIFSPSKTAQEIFLYPVQCGIFTYEPGYSLKRSSFDSFLLMYIQKGTLQLELNGKTQTVHEKTAMSPMAIPPGAAMNASGSVSTGCWPADPTS